MKYYYLRKKELENLYPCLVEISDIPINNYKDVFLEKGLDVIEYLSDNGDIPERIIYDKKSNKIREATEQEKYNVDKDNYILKSGWYIKEGIVKQAPEAPKSILRPSWCLEHERWEESATEQEIRSWEEQKKQDYYKSEFNIYLKLKEEYELGILSEIEYLESQNYIIALANEEEVTRPNSFNKF